MWEVGLINGDGVWSLGSYVVPIGMGEDGELITFIDDREVRVTIRIGNGMEWVGLVSSLAHHNP